MSKIGQKERDTQNHVVKFLDEQLGYDYLGNWLGKDNNQNIEVPLLTQWLKSRGTSQILIDKALKQLSQANTLGNGNKLYEANNAIYKLLRYGVKDKQDISEHNQTVWLIDWQNPTANHFAFAEEVSIQGESKKRPDIVIYINGIALGVIELKRGCVAVEKGIRQNIENQEKGFIRDFFATVQLVMAGNDSQGIRYGTIESKQKYYLEWKEKQQANRLPTNHIYTINKLDIHLAQLCDKKRFIEIIRDFIVFDTGIKKTCRHNQYFGVQAAKKYIANRQDGIIWHTQGSGKSLTMVWLAKWIRENITDARVVIITDRTELDEQIEKVFHGVEEDIYRASSGSDLISTLNTANPWLICSLVHKFGRNGEELTEEEDAKATDEYLDNIKNSIPSDFVAKGNLFVFVDECHRTQSGKLHQAMKHILSDAMFIGFTGTPLMKADKKKSLEVFGPFIHTYKFDEAVTDGVILDLQYEARDIDQHITSQKKVDEWFDIKTQGLSKLAKMQLKQKWGTLQKVLSSKSRLDQIVQDILIDMDSKPALKTGRGNAMLVCDSVHQACTIYSLFDNETDLQGKCAIVTSYKPTNSSIKSENAGAGQTEALFKYKTYRKMLADYFELSEVEAASKVATFEKEVKEKFIEHPGQMRLLIVVDKLLTGFDAPSATYLYIDKKMADHNLFQAICRVNRLDGDDKDYGYIVDYKDLFKSLNKAITDYTGEALEGYDKEDVDGLLKDRLVQGKHDLDTTLEALRTLCEPVRAPRTLNEFQDYFVGEHCTEPEDDNERLEKEALRLTLYQLVAKLIRVYTNLANEMPQAGYTELQINNIKNEFTHYVKLRDNIKLSSGDHLDMKEHEPAMRRLLDLYIRADQSEQLIDFDGMGLIELVIKQNGKGLESLPKDLQENQSAMAEAIENNVRKTIIEENLVNPKYFERMSALLNEIIKQRREQAINYQEYLEKISELAKQVVNPSANNANRYPDSVDTSAKQAIYDNLGNDETLTNIIDFIVRQSKKADWVGNKLKERRIENEVAEKIKEYNVDVDQVMKIIKAQKEYH